jgi:hypothetical protein
VDKLQYLAAGPALMEDETDTYVVWTDNALLLLGSFVLLLAILLPLMNPVTPKTTDGTVQPGTMMVEVKWRDKIDTDVDLWVKAPGDKIIGYSNKAGAIFNLLRDDLGMINDPLNLNYEVAYTRGLPPGEYIINVHLYRDTSNELPVEVTVVVTLQDPVKNSAKRIVEKTVKLSRIGEEITVVRFRIGDDRELVAGSVNDIQRPLRSAKQ